MFTAYLLPFLSLLALVRSQANTCEGYEEHPLVLVSLDGFRYDYVNRGLSPVLQSLMNEGVTVPFMKASYPTVTFPNHYTIVTGLYPETHGIIANSFYDDSFSASFSVGSDESLNGRWWGGDPIWNTVQAQGKKSAAYFWPGSDANITGIYPTYYFNYSGSTPYEDRVDQVLAWLALPVDERPLWICTYFDEPDHSGHDSGPDSDEVDTAIAYVDSILKRLIDGIETMNLTDCVNLIVVADHGMAEAGLERVIQLQEYVPDVADQCYYYYGAFSRLSVWDEYQYLIPEMKSNMSCQQAELRSYEPFELPTRLHFSNNPDRIEDIVLDLNPGYAINVGSSFYLNGQHGYDNYFKVMQPVFVAKGPEFLSGVVAEPFQNIELYQLMCELVGVNPSPNNGTEGSLYSFLVSPPAYPVVPEMGLPAVVPFPDETTLQDRLDDSGCSGDLTSPEPWIYSMDLSSSEIFTSTALNLPWGLQYKEDQASDGFGSDALLLVHQDHVTAYSPGLMMPLWTSFTVGQVLPSGSATSDWSSDVRVETASSIKCGDYDTVQNMTMQPLFPPMFSSNSSLERIPYMVSNSIPMDSYLVARWSELVEDLLPSWIQTSLSPVNVVVGPVFDNNADSYADDISALGGPPQLPSDLFMVVTRCNETVSDLANCVPDALDVTAYIYPEYIEVSNCLSIESYAREFSAKVKDVEIATDLYFYPKLSYEDRTRLAVRINSNIWQ